MVQPIIAARHYNKMVEAPYLGHCALGKSTLYPLDHLDTYDPMQTSDTSPTVRSYISDRHCLDIDSIAFIFYRVLVGR